MKMRWLLLRVGVGRVLAIAALGLASGFASTGFIALMNRVINNQGVTPIRYLIAMFFCLMVAKLATNFWAQWIMVRFAQDKLLGLCEEISKRVVQTPFRTIERIGSARILSTLTDDVNTLTSAIQQIPSLASNTAVLVGCLVYLAYLSWIASLSMFVVTAMGAVCYKLLLNKAYKAIRDARAGRDTLFQYFRSLTEGIKEIKMNTDRQTLLVEDEIKGTANYLKGLNLTATFSYLTADAWAKLMFYMVLGLLLFALPMLKDISLATLTGCAFVSLYAMTPVWGIMGSAPAFQRGEAALERIEALGFSLASGEQAPPEGCSTQASDMETRTDTAAAPLIELDGVRFSYYVEGNGQEIFTLGPINLSLHPGKLIFIIGGNGSGKTTLLKLLVGLYAPESGEIRVDGRPVVHDIQNYRQLFSVVFSDFYIFDRLPNSNGMGTDIRAGKYLELLKLDKKVKIENGVFSTTALSQGQRRRLALLSAYLEDRPVYIFDEWAADQDPAYKEVFYKHLLVELKNSGKTVIVITHDDRYFQLGDVIVKLDFGNIVGCWSPGEPALCAAEPSEIVSFA
jgi:putative ATP-binding cassette transporter